MNPKPITAKEMAALLKVTERTLRMWAFRGAIPYIALPSGSFLFYPNDVIAHLTVASDHKSSS